MNEENLLRQRHRAGVEKPALAVPYTAKDFQLEVLGKLSEMQDMAGLLEKSWRDEIKGIREQRLLKFDSRTLVALGAIALSVSGYVIQDAQYGAAGQRD